MAAEQHPPARLAPSRGEGPGQQFGLVVPAPARTTTTGGRPRDDIDLGGIEPPAELLGEVHREVTAVAVLQPDHEIAAETRELGGGNDAGGRDDRARRNQREAAAAAQIGTRFGTPGTAVDQHVDVVAKGRATVALVPKAPGCRGRTPVGSLAVVVPVSITPLRPYNPRSVTSDWANRLTRCILGLALFGAGDALILHAQLGAAPWDMFHQGLSHKLGISVGTIIVGTGVAILLLWIPLRQRPGIGTILNAVEIGLVVDLVLPRLPDTDRLAPRAIYLVGGLLLVAIGSGMYIGAGLGTGPRDGLMVGFANRGISVRLARTAIELIVGIGGIALGIRPGVGTIIFMFGIGPMLQLFLPFMSLPARKNSASSTSG